MAIPRFYAPALAHNPPTVGQEVIFDAELAHHVAVRRLRAGTRIRLFDGVGNEWEGVLIGNRRGVPCACTLLMPVSPLPEPERPQVLATALLPADRLDWVVQKGVELGVTHWVPLITAYSQVELDQERARKKCAHWRKIAAHAAAQCGRATVPQILPPTPLLQLPQLLAEQGALADLTWYWTHPGAVYLPALSAPTAGLLFLIGPEGGWHSDEVAWLLARQAIPVGLAPWVLRAETAALAALAQSLVSWVDFKREE